MMQALVSFVLVLALSLQALFPAGSKTSGPGNPDGQVTHSLTTTYVLDQAGGLPQVLADGTYTYFYGLDRLAQQGTNQTEYFLPDALGSVRQMTGANGYVTTSQSFDPFGSLSEQISADSVFGYAGEQTDATGLQYLRARYYAPGQGRFLSQDPFPGLLSNPSTLNAYAYVTNDPILMSDPSGQIAPFLAAAGVGGLIGAGMNVFSQLHQMHPQSLEQALRCLDWGQVGISFAAGAVAGLTGFFIYGGMAAFFGTGLMANIASGAVAGAISGQYARLTGLVLSGQIDQIGSMLFRPQDLVMDAVFGGTIAGVSYGISNLLDGIRSQVSANTARVPNPNGKLDGPAHQAEIWNIEIQIKRQGLFPKTEYKIDTPGGAKPYRFADVAALDSNENPVAFYQVAKATKGNLPIARERQAINDIFEFSEYDIPIIFIPFW